MKHIDFTPPRMSDDSAYPQWAVLHDHIGGTEIDRIRASTAPNPLIPGNPDRPNLSEYPIVAPGVYSGVFHKDRHHGRPCVSLKDDGPIWILQDINPRTGAKQTAVGIRIHEGYTASWRGSAGCMTLASPGGDEWLLKHFKDFEKVTIFIPDQDWFARR